MTVCFVDNNIILQLAACNLFEESLNVLSISWNDLRVLSTAVPVFRGKKISKQYSQETIQKAIHIAQRCQKVSIQLCQEYELLLKINGLDPGEVSLITATAIEPSFLLTTGDKRCLEALAIDFRIRSTHQRLSGRVICLEQIFLKLTSSLGTDLVQQRVLSASGCEKAIRLSFGWSIPADEASILEGLNSYINDLQKKSQGLLKI